MENLSIRCDRPIVQREAVELILRNIDNWMTPFLGIAQIITYQDLITCIARLENAHPGTWSGSSGFQPRKEEGRRADVKMAWAPKASPKTVANASTSNNGGNGNSNNNNQVKPGQQLQAAHHSVGNEEQTLFIPKG